MWTAEILPPTRSKRQAVVPIRFTSDDSNESAFTEEFRSGAPTTDDLDSFIKTTIDGLDKVVAFVAAVTPGAAPAPKESPKPTADEIAKAEYFKAARTLSGFRTALKPDDPQILDQEALVKSLFKPEYFD